MKNPFPEPMRTKIVAVVFEAAVLLAIAGVMCWNYFTHGLNPHHYFNADALTVYLFLHDVLVEGGRASSWHFANAPGYLPDFLIGWIAFLLAHGIYVQIFVASLVQVGLLYLAIRVVTGMLVDSNHAELALLVLLPVLLLAVRAVSPYYQALILHWHFGTYLVGLCALAIVLRRMTGHGEVPWGRPADIPSALALYALSYGGTLSDALFLVTYSGPMLLVGLWLWLRGQLVWKGFLAWFLAPMACAWVGHESAPSLIPHFAPLPLVLVSPGVWIDKWGELRALLRDTGWAAWWIAAFFLGVAVRLVAVWRPSVRLQSVWIDRPAHRVLLLFVVSSVLCNLGAVVGSNAMMGDRYLPALFFAPFVFAVLLWPNDWHDTGRLRSIICTLLAFYAAIAWLRGSTPIQTRYAARDVACVDSATRSLERPSGIGGYWLAKRVVAFSTNKVRMVAVNPNLTPHDLLVNGDWYTGRYNFAVIQTTEPLDSIYRLDESILRNYNGAPDEVLQCEGLKILLYRQGLGTTMTSRGNGVYTMKGCRLPRSTGVEDSRTCSLRSTDPAYSGNLSYGPYFSVLPGQYRYTLRYRSENHAENRIGHLDVSFLFPEKYTVLSETPLRGTAGQEATVEGLIDIDNDLARGQLEIRTFIEPGTRIELFGIEVRKVGGL